MRIEREHRLLFILGSKRKEMSRSNRMNCAHVDGLTQAILLPITASAGLAMLWRPDGAQAHMHAELWRAPAASGLVFNWLAKST